MQTVAIPRIVEESEDEAVVLLAIDKDWIRRNALFLAALADCARRMVTPRSK